MTLCLPFPLVFNSFILYIFLQWFSSASHNIRYWTESSYTDIVTYLVELLSINEINVNDSLNKYKTRWIRRGCCQCEMSSQTRLSWGRSMLAQTERTGRRWPGEEDVAGRGRSMCQALEATWSRHVHGIVYDSRLKDQFTGTRSWHAFVGPTKNFRFLFFLLKVKGMMWQYYLSCFFWILFVFYFWINIYSHGFSCHLETADFQIF